MGTMLAVAALLATTGQSLPEVTTGNTESKEGNRRLVHDSMNPGNQTLNAGIKAAKRKMRGGLSPKAYARMKRKQK